MKHAAAPRDRWFLVGDERHRERGERPELATRIPFLLELIEHTPPTEEAN